MTTTEKELGEVNRVLSLEQKVVEEARDGEQRKRRLSTFVLLRHLYKIPEPEGPFMHERQEIRERYEKASMFKPCDKQNLVWTCRRCEQPTSRTAQFDVYNEAKATDSAHGYYMDSDYDTHYFNYCTTCGKNDYESVPDEDLPPVPPPAVDIPLDRKRLDDGGERG
jgi:hypothetical protein